MEMIKELKLGIIGAGAAGLSAALLAGRQGMDTFIFDTKTGGGRAGGIPYIISFPGFEKIKGSEFIKTLKNQVKALNNVSFHELEEVMEISPAGEGFRVRTIKDTYIFNRLILAMGVEHKKLNITGESEFSGRGVSYCAACDGLFFRNKNTVVIGNDTHAVEQALFLNDLQANVTLVNPWNTWEAESKILDDLHSTNVNVLKDVSVTEIYGERLVGGVKIAVNSDENLKKEYKDLDAKGIFISVGFSPRTQLVSRLGIELTTENYLKIDNDQRTKIRGLYAVGDITDPDLEVVSVCASGVNAVKTILNELK